MDLLVKVITESGKNEYHVIQNIENVVIYEDRTNKARLQINKDISVCEPVKPKDIKKIIEGE